jgi:hypothetical protein
MGRLLLACAGDVAKSCLGMLRHARFVLSRLSSSICVSRREQMESRPDRQRGVFGAHPLGPRRCRAEQPSRRVPTRRLASGCWYAYRPLFGHDLPAPAHSRFHFASRLRIDRNSRRRFAFVFGKVILSPSSVSRTRLIQSAERSLCRRRERHSTWRSAHVSFYAKLDPKRARLQEGRS